MKYLKYIIFGIIVMMLFSSSCASKKSVEPCEIKEVLDVIVKNDSLYSMHIKFSNCDSKDSRESLIKEELRNRFLIIKNKTIRVKEYLGKMYNEYKYEITVE